MQVLRFYNCHDRCVHFLIKIISFQEYSRENLLNRFTSFAFQLFSALAYLHNMGICHGDVKPNNITFVPSSLYLLGWQLTLLDYGMAQRCDKSHQHFSICRGTAAFRSPESTLMIGNIGFGMINFYL